MEAGTLNTLLDQPDGRAILEAEAADADQKHRLITKDQLAHLLATRREARRPDRRLGAFFSTDDAIIVPGFMGSRLSDATGGNGLIWIDPKLVINGDQLSALRLAHFAGNVDTDAEPGVRIESYGSIPAIYDVMTLDLEVRRYDVQVFPFDWRKDIERSATLLADRIRARLGRKPRPLHVIAHSQGAVVARRAIQLLGAEDARRLVNNLLLLGPATFGTFSAAFAIAGTHETIAAIQKYGVTLPANFEKVLQSFTGLYQLLPWDRERFPNDFDPEVMKPFGYWKRGADSDRLKYGFAWGKRIDTTFFNDRTAIILGEQPTVGAVAFQGDKLVPVGQPVAGDGTVPDFCAMLPGVRTYRAAGADHMTLPMYRSVLAAVRAILKGEAPSIDRFAAAGGPAFLQEPPLPRVATEPEKAKPSHATPPRPQPPAPPCRKLRVFSFDPLLATNLDTLDIAEISIDVPWEAEGSLGVGPVGEYLEVVDYDPASNCFYPPVDLTHPRLTAQDGLPPSESNPQFHQQMVYAVAMATIATFEKALGRVALWAPRLERDEDGECCPEVGRGTIRSAVTDLSARPARGKRLLRPGPPRPAVRLLPVARATRRRDAAGRDSIHLPVVRHRRSRDDARPATRAAPLLPLPEQPGRPRVPRGVRRRRRAVPALLAPRCRPTSDRADPRRPDARDSFSANSPGSSARRLGEHHGALRQYVDAKPDPTLYGKTDEPHDRGAILMAALFRAFLNIYENRVKDLYRIATGGTGRLPDGDIHPDLVNRLAIEASKSAQHILTMCVRALDYVPPADITFGEYLRALITADYDLVRDDDRGYRVAVIDAFRSWGFYPSDVNVLDESALRWRPLDTGGLDVLRQVIADLRFSGWTLRADRRAVFLQMQENGASRAEVALRERATMGDEGESLGLVILGKQLPEHPAEQARPARSSRSTRSARAAESGRTASSGSTSWPRSSSAARVTSTPGRRRSSMPPTTVGVLGEAKRRD